LIPRAPRVLRGLATVERKHASMAPHMYLAVLGVEPERQGLGLGSQLLRPGLELCDAEGLPAYLETGKERNLAFYGRHGFDVIDQIVLPGGPPLWFMWREAR
jgi:GNAT superfamily N-acetyltransferase